MLLLMTVVVSLFETGFILIIKLKRKSTRKDLHLVNINIDWYSNNSHALLQVLYEDINICGYLLYRFQRVTKTKELLTSTVNYIIFN